MNVSAADAARRRRASPRGVLFALLLTTLAIVLPMHFVDRWRADNKGRLLGLDTQLRAETRLELGNAARQLRTGTGDDRLQLAKASRQAVADSPWSPELWLRLAASEQELGSDEQAGEYLNIARAIDPTNPDLRALLGNEVFFLTGPRDALADHRAALRLGTERDQSIHLAWLQSGYDAVAVARGLLPTRPASFERYFLSLVDAAPVATVNRLWQLALAWPEPKDGSIESKTDRRESSDASRALRVGHLGRRFLARLSESDDSAAVLDRYAVLAELTRRRLDGYQEWQDDDDPFLAREGGLWNGAARVPLFSLGDGDWVLPDSSSGVTFGRVAAPSADERFLDQRGDAHVPADPMSPWFALRLSAYEHAPIRLPAQAMRLAGPARYVLRYEVATERLYTTKPISLVAEVRAVADRNDTSSTTGRDRVFYSRSETFEGNRGARVREFAFNVPFDGASMQLLRFHRDAGAADDPPLSGAVYLRFIELRREPLPDEERLKLVESSDVRALMDELERPLFPHTLEPAAPEGADASELPAPGGPDDEPPADQE